MCALNLATEGATAILDWNNNYGDDGNKVILFVSVKSNNVQKHRVRIFPDAVP